MSKEIVLALALLLICTATAAADPGDIMWTRTYGGTEQDLALSVRQTTDGGYIIAGSTNSFGADSSFYLIKTDASGDTIWTHTYYGAIAYSVQQTTDGGYIVAGKTHLYGLADVHIIKTDASGDTIWTRTYGEALLWDEAYSVEQTTDGGYIISGSTYPNFPGSADFYLIKIDASGDSIWTQTYGGTGHDEARSVQQTTDGGYIIAGFLSGDFYLVKTNTSGDTLWTRTYGGTSGEQAYSVQQTTDGGYIIAGCTGSFGAGENDFYIVKTDFSGDTLWTRTYGGASSDVAYSVQQTTDEGYIVAGHTYSFGAGESDFYLVKTDAFGDTLWTRTSGGTSFDVAYSVRQIDNGGYIVAGFTQSFGAGDYDFYLVKVAGVPCLTCSMDIRPDLVPCDNSVPIQWELSVTNCGGYIPVYVEIYPTVGDCASGTPYDYNINRMMTSGLEAGATYTAYYHYYPGDVCLSGLGLVAISADVGPAVDDWFANCCDEFFFTTPFNYQNGSPEPWGFEGTMFFEVGEGELLPKVTSLGQNYPNPFNAATIIDFELAESGNVTLKVFNLAGQKIEELIDSNLPAGHHNITWDASTYSSGIYFYKLTAGENTCTKRMTLLK
ncbi:MAG: T9SS type A sorting domain-containing protein [candidate division Zixibacteria bacterium]|nr:T9SS type A sorting domain-containing protein [candidate division Zixibacteria bacterium]